MRRRVFLKGLVAAIGVVAVPFDLTDFGNTAVADLSAALRCDHPVGLRIESLEHTFQATTYRLDEIKLWKPMAEIGRWDPVGEHHRRMRRVR